MCFSRREESLLTRATERRNPILCIERRDEKNGAFPHNTTSPARWAMRHTKYHGERVSTNTHTQANMENQQICCTPPLPSSTGYAGYPVVRRTHRQNGLCGKFHATITRALVRFKTTQSTWSAWGVVQLQQHNAQIMAMLVYVRLHSTYIWCLASHARARDR